MHEEALFFEFKNQKGTSLKLTNIGASIAGVFAKDKNGELLQISFGSDESEFYLNNPHYIGSSIGRVANRIIDAQFYLNDKLYKLAKNNNKHHLHGGLKALSSQIFQSKMLKQNCVLFSYFSKAGEENYPANVDIKILYTLSENNEIIIDFKATSDGTTPLNLTNHAYWNLNGCKDIYEHEFFIDAPFYLPITEDGVPSGEILKTADSIFDFKSLKKLPKKDGQVCSYDHCFIFEDRSLKKPKARVFSAKSGIALELFTSKPSLHFYTGNGLDAVKVRNGVLNRHFAFCLEAEYFPASVNFMHFPSIILKAGEKYEERIIYKVV